MQMDFKILLLVLCITFVSVQGAIPRCCVATAPLPFRMLKRVVYFTKQNRNGVCDIDAIVVHVDGKRLCAPVWQTKRLERLKSIMTGKKNF